MQESKSKLFKQRLFRMHASAGIVFSLIMYLSIFFGIFAIFIPYIKQWEKPSRSFEVIQLERINYDFMLNETLKDPKFPKNNIIINLPGYVGDPALSVTHRFAKPVSFNPNTNEKLNDEGTNSHLAEFLNELHYGQPLMLIGRIIFGLVAVGSMALIVTGVIMIIIMRFSNKGKSQQGVFSNYHVKILTYCFPILFLIILSGAVMNVGLISAGPMSNILSNGKANSIDALVGKVLFPRGELVKKSSEKVPMQKINELLLKAQEINPQLNFKQIKLINWEDKTARIEFIGYNPYKPFLNGGIFNKPSVTLSAYSGELIKNKRVFDNKWSVFIAEIIFFLHFLFGVDIFSRILVALVMLATCIAIGFGVMLYLEKKAKEFREKVTFYHWMGKLSLATIIGVIPATATLFLLQWLLPFDLENRLIWQQGIFYNVWLFTLFWSFFRINSYQASKELFFSAGVIFLLVPILHLITYKTFNANILAVDIALFLFAILLIFISKKLPNNRDEAKLFWTKKQKAQK